MEKLMVINHPDFGEVRNVMIKGEPWFVAQDICKALGHSNSRMLLSGLDKDEVDVTKIYIRSENGVNQQREVQIVNESGLYTLIMRSNKAESKPFRKWVTGEVLPAIRKYGFYIHLSARLSKQEETELKRLMLDETKRYIIKEDIKRCARRFGVDTWDVDMVLAGKRIDNDMMTDLQSRALANRENWKDAYHPQHMMEVVNQLKGKKMSNRILVPTGAKLEIQKKTGASQPTIRKALDGKTDTPLARLIRAMAKNSFGGVEVVKK